MSRLPQVVVHGRPILQLGIDAGRAAVLNSHTNPGCAWQVYLHFYAFACMCMKSYDHLCVDAGVYAHFSMFCIII